MFSIVCYRACSIFDANIHIKCILAMLGVELSSKKNMQTFTLDKRGGGDTGFLVFV